MIHNRITKTTIITITIFRFSTNFSLPSFQREGSGKKSLKMVCVSLEVLDLPSYHDVSTVLPCMGSDY